ncbi:MAG: hypothetical protein DWQ35_01795 [Planctomycetota bacterium]|nr:MAG: hypothetical protein DWQ35_01795 [Planctomycetota bacterium]
MPRPLPSARCSWPTGASSNRTKRNLSMRLFKQFILRALWREKVRSVVAILGVALGVAVMVAIRLANVSVVETFSAAVDSVGGHASLRIRGRAGRFDERLLLELDGLRRFGQLSPVIETQAMIAEPRIDEAERVGFPRGDLLHVLGVDILLDYPLRDYHVLATQRGGEQSAREVLSLLSDPYSVILTEKFLRRAGLRVGDKVPLVFDSTTQEFTIRGVLLNRGPARTLDGNFALMDIAAAQWAAKRLGVLDYVDILLEEGVDPARAEVEIAQLLPAGLLVETPEAASGRSQTMIAAFQFNLAALSAVALVVGLFLIYNTVAISVAARRREIALLQIAGAPGRTVLRLFLGEAFLLAFIGLAIGLPTGRLLAAQAVQGTAQTVETFYIQGVAESSAAALRLSLTEVVVAALIAIPLALLAALVPALEAASLSPVATARGLGSRWGARRLRLLLLGSLTAAAGGYALTFGPPLWGRPVLGFLAELLFMIAGALLVPSILRVGCRLAQRLAELLPRGGNEMRLAAANLLGALPRVSISVAALSVSLSMMIAIAVMVGSFRETVIYWLESALSADLAAKPVMQTSAVSEATLSPQAVKTIRQDPAVADTIWFSSRQVVYRETNIRLAVTELDKTFERARLLLKEGPPDRYTADWGTQADVLVSESFAIHFDCRVGDVVELPTRVGQEPFTVVGVYYDYASNQGTVMMDMAVYERHYALPGVAVTPQAMSVFLAEGADPGEVRTRIVNQLGADEQIYLVTNRELRREVLRIFESTFTVTYALQLIAIVIAGLGVAATLITLIYQRQRELGLLSLLGATYRQIRRVIVLEAILLGGVSQLLGTGIGILLALVLIHVINVQSFGWTIQVYLPYAFFLQSTLLVLIASALFGLYPAIWAARENALAVVRQE